MVIPSTGLVVGFQIIPDPSDAFLRNVRERIRGMKSEPDHSHSRLAFDESTVLAKILDIFLDSRDWARKA
jgi:hypothetical protein